MREPSLKNGLQYAKDKKIDVVIIDTAGRLHIDEKDDARIKRCQRNR